MPHDDATHRQAIDSGDYADETLFDDPTLTVGLIHFADGSHSVRLDLFDRGMSVVLDTPAWLDLDMVLNEVSADEPTLGSGYVTVERETTDDDVAYRLTIQGGDVVGRVSLILLEEEVSLLRAALSKGREAVESADTVDHEAQMPGLGNGQGAPS